MAETEAFEGGCLCGRLRYRITGPIGHVVHCHCALCRRSSGGTLVTWFTVPVEHFALTAGEAAAYRSSSHAERRFCPACGTQLTFHSKRYPDTIDITLATLDRPADHRPSHHIWTSSRLPWLHLDEDLPGFPEDGPPEGTG